MSLHPQAEAIAPKIKYELNMFQYCYSRIQQEWAAANDGLRNLLLEDFLLHARVLRAFFVDSPRQDDVSASHFFDGSAPWATASASLCSYLKHHKTRLDKYIAHLTYSRLNEDKNWDPDIVYGEITAAWKQFFSMLSPERHGWF